MKTTHLNLAKIATLLFIGIGIVLSSCSGEDGKDGVNGEMGPPGKDGQDGNANVVVSDWMPFVWSYTNGVDYAWMNIPIENIMDFVEDGAIVMVYLRYDYNGTNVRPLPIIDSNTFEFSYGKFGTSFFGIRVYVYHSDIDAVENDPGIRVRYVLVPANVAETSGISNNIPENFDEAATLLGLEQ